MNTEIQSRARRIIRQIEFRLDPNLVRRLLDEPIARVIDHYECRAEHPITPEIFLEIVGDFTKQIYDRALNAAWTLTDPRAKAISLLESYYRSVAYGAGYSAAFLDADDPAQGSIRTVLARLAQSIRSIEYTQYTRYVFHLFLSDSDWSLRCEMARILLDEYGAFLPERLSRCVPAQLVDLIPSIILAQIGSESTVLQILSGGEGPLIAETGLGGGPL
jgi:hypothetical protein